MKKAKLMLAGIACMAVIGGAYAVKANRFGGGNVYTTYATLGTISYCTLVPTLSFTTNPLAPIITAYTGTAEFKVCLGKTTTFVTTVP